MSGRPVKLRKPSALKTAYLFAKVCLNKMLGMRSLLAKNACFGMQLSWKPFMMFNSILNKVDVE